MQTQNSLISYVPQPYFTTTAPTITGQSNVASIENGSGVFDPDLSNYATVVPTSSVTSFSFQLTFGKQSAYLTNADMTLALLGCAMLTYEDDGFGLPDLTTEFSENLNCQMSSNVGDDSSTFQSYAHNSQDTVHTFGKTAMPGVISGGRTNIVFSGIGKSTSGSSATVTVTFERVTADVTARPHVRLVLGHLFIGVDVSIYVEPNSFSWTIEVANDRFTARDYGAINSDGTLVKRSAGEIIKIVHDTVVGSEVTSLSPEVATLSPNLFDLIKSHTSYPLLFNPYPKPGVLASSLTLAEANLTVRQNYFSIYGFLSNPLELLTSQWRNGLDSEYRARYRIIETR